MISIYYLSVLYNLLSGNINVSFKIQLMYYNKDITNTVLKYFIFIRS